MAPRDDPGLHDPRYERDSCGFGLIAQLDDKPARSTVDAALEALPQQWEAFSSQLTEWKNKNL